MKLRHLIYSLIFVLGFSTMAACKKQTCPTYATSAPSKKSKKSKQKNAPWHKSRTMKKGKAGATPQ